MYDITFMTGMEVGGVSLRRKLRCETANGMTTHGVTDTGMPAEGDWNDGGLPPERTATGVTE